MKNLKKAQSTQKDFTKMKFLENFIQETLRLLLQKKFMINVRILKEKCLPPFYQIVVKEYMLDLTGVKKEILMRVNNMANLIAVESLLLPMDLIFCQFTLPQC